MSVCVTCVYVSVCGFGCVGRHLKAEAVPVPSTDKKKVPKKKQTNVISMRIFYYSKDKIKEWENNWIPIIVFV